MSKDYFIKDTMIDAYTITAFAEAIVEATKQGIALDYDSACRVGMSFSISFAKQGEEVELETEEASADQEEAEVQQEQSESKSGEDSEEDSVGITLEQIEAAADSMEKLKELAEPFDITGRSKADLVEKLKELL